MKTNVVNNESLVSLIIKLIFVAFWGNSLVFSQCAGFFVFKKLNMVGASFGCVIFFFYY